MDKKIKQSILILGVLIALSVAFAIVFYLQKQEAESRVAVLSGQVANYETKDAESQKKLKALQEDSVKLRQDIDRRTAENADLVKRSEQSQRDAEKLNQSIDKFQKDRADLDEKLANIRKERDGLLKQITELKNRPEKVVEKVVYRDNPVAALAPAAAPAAAPAPQGPDGVSPKQAMNDIFAAAVNPTVPSSGQENETYWAGVIREKAALELQLQRAKADTSSISLQLNEIRKSNSDLEMELGRVKNEKEAIIRKIKYGEDLADNISVELARARNEQKVSQDRAELLLNENQKLRLDIKQLTSTKVALEKSIANLSQEKGDIEKKLTETESIIQSRMDEMMQIKKDIDRRVATVDGSKAQGEVELAPIVVSGGKAVRKAASKAAPAAKKLQGTVVSVNEENNFVIVDLGEKSGIQVGDAFKVYHNGAQIGMVEVIQVRQDISAADIKQKTAPFSVGDTVR